jgi:hypothetical protein
MKTGLKTLVIIAFAVIFGFSLAGCKDPSDGNLIEDTTKPDSITEDPIDIVPDIYALRAFPVASSSSVPIVLGSYSEGDRNYYLIDVGFIRNTFVSEIVSVTHYNGLFPVSKTRTVTSEKIITEAVTETVSNSVTISDTQSHKVGVEASWEKSFPFAGKFSAKLSYEWKGEWTNTNTSGRSQATSVSTAERKLEQESFSFTLGANGEPAGWYRYALYAVSDVYFIISTDLENKELKSWDTLVCVRDNSYMPHWDYSPEMFFDNSPVGEITFSEDFYKNLPKPTNQVPVLPPQNTFKWTDDWVTIRTGEYKITGSGRFNQDFDAINFEKFTIDGKKINLNTMRQEGYKTISFYIRLNVREVDDGYQYIFLFNSPIKDNKYLITTVRFEHTPGKYDGNWWVHYESQLKFENISIDKFMNNEFVLRYGASGSGFDDWKNKDLKVQLLFNK